MIGRRFVFGFCLLLFFITPILANDEINSQYLTRKERSNRIGTILYFAGTGSTYLTPFFARELGENSTSTLTTLSSGFQISGLVIASVSAKKSFNMMNKLYGDSYTGPQWDRRFLKGGIISRGVGYSVGVPLLFIGFLEAWNGELDYMKAGFGVMVSGIVLSDILFSIHMIKARKVSKASKIAAEDMHSGKVSLGVGTCFNSAGDPGISMVFSF